MASTKTRTAGGTAGSAAPDTRRPGDFVGDDKEVSNLTGRAATEVARQDGAPHSQGSALEVKATLSTQSRRRDGLRVALEKTWRRVFFRVRKSFHEVDTTYGEEYGVHPRFFQFDRHGVMRLTDDGLAENMRREEAGEPPLQLAS